MKKNHSFLNVVLVGILSLMPISLFSKEAPKADFTVMDCQLPDGTVCDINLFKFENKFNNDMQANIGEQTKNNIVLYNEIRIFRNYRKLRSMTWEEWTAWKNDQTPVQDELFCIMSCTAKESSLLGLMKSNKTPYGSSYTEEEDRVRVVIVTADKKYSSLTYERFYLVARTPENVDAATMEKVILPDGTETDLVFFLSDREVNQYYNACMNPKDPNASLEIAAAVLATAISGIPVAPEEGEKWKWERVYTPTKNDRKKAQSNGGSITMPGYVYREYGLDKMGDLGLFMKKNEIPTAIIITDTGDKKRQEILVNMDMNWNKFFYQKVDYVYKQKK